MNINSLAYEIRRGLWALDVTMVDSYWPLVHNVMAGKGHGLQEIIKAESLLGILDSQGNVKMPDENGRLDLPPHSVAQVSMIGEVIKNGDYCVYGADEICNALYAADRNPNIDATVFKIDGPGGAVSAIDTFRQFAKYKTKPIVGLLDDALSLHYWTAVEECDFLIANGDVAPRFGSVGVVASWRDYSKAMEEAGVKEIEVYGPESQHKNLVFTNARKGDYKMLQDEQLSPLELKFKQSVRNGRPNLKEAEGVLTGKTFYADEALSYNMIDAIGNSQDAVNKARALALNYKIREFNH